MTVGRRPLGPGEDPDRQQRAERHADHRDVVEVEPVEKCPHRLVPVGLQRHAPLLQRAALAGAFEGDHPVAGVGQGPDEGEHLLDVGSHAALEHHGALIRAAEVVGGQLTASVRDGMDLIGADAVHLAQDAHEPVAQPELACLRRRHEVLGRPQAEGAVETVPLRQQLLAAGEEGGGEVGQVRLVAGGAGEVKASARR